MRQEELALAVDEQGVRFGTQDGCGWQAEGGTYSAEDVVQCAFPVGAAQGEPVRGDLPGVAHAGVGQGLLTAAEAGLPGLGDQFPGDRGAQRQLKLAEAVHVDTQCAGVHLDAGTEVPALLRMAEQLRQSLPCSLSHGVSAPLAGSEPFRLLRNPSAGEGPCTRMALLP